MNSDNDLFHQTLAIKEKPNGSFKPLKLLGLFAIVIFIAVIAGAGGYLMGIKKNQSASQSTQCVSLQPNPSSHQLRVTQLALTNAQPSPFLASSDQAERDPTIAHWKTYTNDKYGFSIMIPQNLQHSFIEDVNRNAQAGIKSLDLESFYQGIQTECCGYEGPNFTISIFPVKGNSQWVWSYDLSPSDKESNFIIAGIAVKKLSALAGIRIGPLEHNGYIYRFELFGKDKKDVDFKDIYTMLSTFRFMQ